MSLDDFETEALLERQSECLVHLGAAWVVLAIAWVIVLAMVVSGCAQPPSIIVDTSNQDCQQCNLVPAPDASSPADAAREAEASTPEASPPDAETPDSTPEASLGCCHPAMLTIQPVTTADGSIVNTCLVEQFCLSPKFGGTNTIQCDPNQQQCTCTNGHYFKWLDDTCTNVQALLVNCYPGIPDAIICQ